jgi:hypothetical protein
MEAVLGLAIDRVEAESARPVARGVAIIALRNMTKIRTRSGSLALDVVVFQN